ncbi:MAG: hypothetical protein AB1938_14770 [Myxococcota bacterium]
MRAAILEHVAIHGGLEYALMTEAHALEGEKGRGSGEDALTTANRSAPR